jgi:hypothetical protein
MDPVKVAAVQAAPVLLDRDETIGKVIALTEKAAAEGARLVAFPEAFVPGYPDWVWRTRPWDADATALYARLYDQAVIVGSPATEVLAETAGRLGIWLSVGVDERDDQDSTITAAATSSVSSSTPPRAWQSPVTTPGKTHHEPQGGPDEHSIGKAGTRAPAGRRRRRPRGRRMADRAPARPRGPGGRG